MTPLTICLALFAIIDIGYSISTKLDFDEEKESAVAVASKEDEDVEVKHTIVVSTKLKTNNNHRGLHSGDGDGSAQIFSIGHASNSKKEDSGEVPIIKGYKSVDSTLITSPDTRDKRPSYMDSVFINRNIRDGYDTYPIASNPSQWKPSSFFNNVNWWNDDTTASFNGYGRRRDWPSRSQEKFHRTVTDDGVREFYCRKCREMSDGLGSKGCIQQRSNPWFYETTTTPKIKIDGKLAKFN